MISKICSKCKNEKKITKYLSSNQKKEYKMCNICRITACLLSKKRNCIHNKRITYCILCGGNSLCIPHEKIIKKCDVCSKLDFCIHLNKKQNCKYCKSSTKCYHNKRKYNCEYCFSLNNTNVKDLDIDGLEKFCDTHVFDDEFEMVVL